MCGLVVLVLFTAQADALCISSGIFKVVLLGTTFFADCLEELPSRIVQVFVGGRLPSIACLKIRLDVQVAPFPCVRTSTYADRRVSVAQHSCCGAHGWGD